MKSTQILLVTLALSGVPTQAAQGPCGFHSIAAAANARRAPIAVNAEHVIFGGDNLTSLTTYRRDPATGQLILGDVISGPFAFAPFGSALSLAGDRLAVLSAHSNGSVETWRFDGAHWVLESRLPQRPFAFDGSYGLVLGDDTLAFSSPIGVEIWDWDGAAAVWNQDQVVPRPSGGNLLFAQDIAFDGRTLAIGDPANERVMVYRRLVDGSLEWQQAIGAAVSGFGRFGTSIELDRSTLVIAREGIRPRQSVEVYRFIPSLNGWTFAQRIDSPELGGVNSVLQEYFGTHLRLSRGTLLVGAPGARMGTFEPVGAILVYKELANSGTFRLERVLDGVSATPPLAGRLLGLEIALHDGIAAVARSGPGATALNHDSWHIFAPGSTDCDQDGTADACEILRGLDFDDNRNGFVDSCEAIGMRYCAPAAVNSAGSAARLSAFGSPLVLLYSVDLVVTGLPRNVLGYVVASQGNQVSVDPANWQGSLCIGGAPQSGPVGGLRNSGPQGRFDIWTNRPVLPLGGGLTPILPGTTWNFQCWYSDPGAMPSATYSDALAIQFGLF